MPFPDSRIKAPNVFIDTIDEAAIPNPGARSPVPRTPVRRPFIPPVVTTAIRWFDPPNSTDNPISISNPISTVVEFPPLSNFSMYGDFAGRNGYDGDVGVYGYIGSIPPYSVSSGSSQINEFDPDNHISYEELTTGINNGNIISVGSGNASDPFGFVSPFNVGDTREFILPTNTYFHRRYFLPMTPGDQIWIVEINFLGYDLPFTVNAVVGPDPSTGEQYLCYGNDRSVPNGIISIQRISWSGDR